MGTDSEDLSVTRIRSRDGLGRRLRTIARIAAECRAASAVEERNASTARDPQQLTIGQLMVLVALWRWGRRPGDWPGEE